MRVWGGARHTLRLIEEALGASLVLRDSSWATCPLFGACGAKRMSQLPTSASAVAVAAVATRARLERVALLSVGAFLAHSQTLRSQRMALGCGCSRCLGLAGAFGKCIVRASRRTSRCANAYEMSSLVGVLREMGMLVIRDLGWGNNMDPLEHGGAPPDHTHPSDCRSEGSAQLPLQRVARSRDATRAQTFWAPVRGTGPPH